jgi:hypothetical protein
MKAVLSGLMPALFITPHKKELTLLKFQCERVMRSGGLQRAHWGKSLTRGDGGNIAESIRVAVESLPS